MRWLWSFSLVYNCFQLTVLSFQRGICRSVEISQLSSHLKCEPDDCHGLDSKHRQASPELSFSSAGSIVQVVYKPASDLEQLAGGVCQKDAAIPPSTGANKEVFYLAVAFFACVYGFLTGVVSEGWFSSF